MNLPPEADREALLVQLRELLARRGAAEFVLAPVLEYSETSFPDQWRADLEGAKAMLGRLLAYAGITTPFELEPFRTDALWLPASGLGGVSWQRVPLENTRAYFAGERPDGVLIFGIDELALGNPEELAGLLAHEVAHAWRHRHQLVSPDRALEEELTDLTTIVLGFGLLTVNNGFRERTTLHLEGGMTWTRYSAAWAGYLSVEALSWLLAVQLAVRGDAALVAKLETALEPSQRRTFHEARAELDRDALWRTLALPLREQLRFTPAAQPPPRRLPPPASVPDDAAPGAIAFRMRARASPTIILGSALVGVILCIPARNLLPVLVLPALYLAWMKLVPRYVCAGVSCDRALDEADDTCPRCGATIVGEINRLRDRHDEMRRWRDEHGQQDDMEDDLQEDAPS